MLLFASKLTRTATMLQPPRTPTPFVGLQQNQTLLAQHTGSVRWGTLGAPTPVNRCEKCRALPRLTPYPIAARGTLQLPGAALLFRSRVRKKCVQSIEHYCKRREAAVTAPAEGRSPWSTAPITRQTARQQGAASHGLPRVGSCSMQRQHKIPPPYLIACGPRSHSAWATRQ